MTIMRSHNILSRGLSLSARTLTASQLRVDALLSSVGTISADWKTAALALVVPAVASRVLGIFRSGMMTTRIAQVGELSFAEVGATTLLRASSASKWGRAASAILGTGTLLTACGEESGVGDAGDAGRVPAPRSLEAAGNEYSVSAVPSAGTNQGIAATLNAAGQLAISWADLNSVNSNPSTVFLRTFSDSGSPGAVIEVESPVGAVSLSPSLSNDEAGNVLVAWTNSTGNDAPSGLRARRYTSALQAQGNSFPIVPLENHNPLIQGSVALNADGSFIVVSNENSSDCGVCVRTYGADNVQRSVQTLSEANVPVLASDLARTSHGDWAWAGLLDTGNGGRSLRFRFYNHGQGFGPLVTVPIENPGAGLGIKIAVLPNRNSLVLWQTSQGLRGQVFTADGSRVGEQASINSLPAGYNYSVGSDQQGAFVVTWEDSGHIRASLLSSQGRVISDNLDVSGVSEGQNSSPVLSSNENGDLTFVWRRFAAGSYSIQARNYQINY